LKKWQAEAAVTYAQFHQINGFFMLSLQRQITPADKLNHREVDVFDQQHQKLAQEREQRKLFWQ